jgi:hypothetical protein
VNTSPVLPCPAPPCRCMCMPKAVYDSVCRTRRPPAGMLGPEWKVLLESYCLDDREWPQVEFVTERSEWLRGRRRLSRS